ncbi:flagellin N-terminal helical domain-containing protein [Iodobacter ciconiae]|uniref:Flagellin n=1 Tax=Iodobacter ciconiae TaxID=2496266 RepID=A0A3S8ZT62_9NEIS|nr:flagellin [Iodobacter ciconiae]AZN36687.1 flagellin FliC [Iodobacter ciconiae]
MVLGISTNLPSLNTQNNLSSAAANKSLNELSSAKRNTQADPASTVIIEQFAAQIAGSNQARSNLNDGISLTQVADGALGTIQDNTQRIRELSIAAGNDTLSSQDRAAIQEESNQLSLANADIVQNTRFNNSSLLQGQGNLNFQAGANAGDQLSLSRPDLTKLSSSTGQIDLSSSAAAGQSLFRLDRDLAEVSGARSEYGAISNRLTASAANLQNRSENLSAAKSRIADTDYLTATANLVQQQVRAQANTALQVQANAAPQQVLSLLRS